MLTYPPSCHEAHLPAPQCPSRAHARLPRPHVDTRWPQGALQPTPQGAQAPRAHDLQEVVPASFGRDRRVRKHGEFVRAQHGSSRGVPSGRVATEHFTLLVAEQPPPPRPARLGIVAPRKVGGAVRRNRAKRLCRECFRSWPDLLPPGVDLLVIVRGGAPELSCAQVREEWRKVERLLQKRAADVLARSAERHHVGPGKNGTDAPRS
jgi:ribonuclease P protein component